MVSEEKLTQLVGGPKDGEMSKQKPRAGKIIIRGTGFQAEEHIYKMSSLLNRDGESTAIFEETK